MRKTCPSCGHPRFRNKRVRTAPPGGPNVWVWVSQCTACSAWWSSYTPCNPQDPWRAALEPKSVGTHRGSYNR